jgi:hypothetical protein
MSLRKNIFFILFLGILAIDCPDAQAANHDMAGEAGGMGGAGGAGGNEDAAGNAGGAGIGGGAGGAGGGKMEHGATGAAGAAGANANGGAAGSGGRGGKTDTTKALAGGGGGGGGGGKGGDGARNMLSGEALETLTLGGGAGGMGGMGGAGGDSMGGNADGAGDGGDGGDGGGGGGVSLVADRAAKAGGIILTGGKGGAAARGGDGGPDNGDGRAGNGGQGGSGGQGGDALLSLREARATGDITLTGGDGGSGGNGGAGKASGGGQGKGGDGGDAGAAGNGGDAVLALEAQAVTTGRITLASGAKGATGSAGVTSGGVNDGKGGQGSAGGAGGMASFSARRLVAPSLHLFRQDGALNFRAETLDVRSLDTTVILEHTRADEVDFGRIRLGGGQTLDMSRAAPAAYQFAALEVEGGHTAFITGDMNLQERALVFAPSPTLEEGATLLRISGEADVDRADVGLPDLIGLQGGRSQRDTLSLLKAGSLKGTPKNEGTRAKGLQGVSILYDYMLKTSPQQGTMQLEAVSSRAASQGKALAEGFLGGLALLNQGANLAADKGMSVALKRARQQTGHHLFAALSGGSLRQRSGSHIDLDSVALIAGISAETRFAAGRLVAGAFAEYGRGDYETDNRLGAADQALSFSGARHVRGRGDSRYAGGGALVHYAADSGYHAEASLRAGRLKTRFFSADLRDFLGRHARYDLATPYYGAHVGAGRFLILGEGRLDLYGKYFWMRQQGERVTLSTGDDLRFNASQSERLRAGLRLNWPLASIWKSYVGLAYERESDGKASAVTRTHTRAYAIDAPKLKGDSGMFEIGLSVQQGKGAPLSLDLGLQGYTGRREGVIGGVHMDWAF